MTNLGKCLDKINLELDNCIDKGEDILDELRIQDEKIEKILKKADIIEENITWSEYLINIINSYFGFLWLRAPKFAYKNNININNNNDDNNNSDDDIKEILSEDNDDFFKKINKVRKLAYKIGDELDVQNEKLFNQNTKIDKLNYKINEDLINQINV
jgi:hypothetical protein